MKTKLFRLSVVFTLVIALAAGAFFILEKEREKEAKVELELPTALGKHIEKLAEAIPGNGGEPKEGPGSYEDYQFDRLAYPDTDIPLSSLEAERAAVQALTSHKLPSGKGRPGTWVSIGPSDALYPFTQFRSSYSYVPNDYLAGGRTVALAVSSVCVEDNCRMWAAPAGGGIWRTENALNGQPNWAYLSGSYGINAVGSIALDPNDPTGNTLWVGTGEANACGSGCIAGVGLYKSTDGGNTWTGPYGKEAFNARGVGSLVVMPGNSNVIYAASTHAGRGISSVATGGVVTLVQGHLLGACINRPMEAAPGLSCTPALRMPPTAILWRKRPQAVHLALCVVYARWF